MCPLRWRGYPICRRFKAHPCALRPIKGDALVVDKAWTLAPMYDDQAWGRKKVVLASDDIPMVCASQRDRSPSGRLHARLRKLRRQEQRLEQRLPSGTTERKCL